MKKKCVLDLLIETSKIGAKPCNTLMIPNLHFTKDNGRLFRDPKEV